jgi:hypothetical protein
MESQTLVAGPMAASSMDERRPTTDVSTSDMMGPASQMPSVGSVKRSSVDSDGTASSAEEEDEEEEEEEEGQA